MNYKVYQGDELKQTVTSKTAVMNGLQPNKTYEFGVEPDNTLTGADGKPRYTHVAYANSADGKNGFYVDGGTNLLLGSDKSISGWAQDLGTMPNEVLNSLAGETITISVDTEWSDYQQSDSKQNRLGFELAISGSDGKSYWFGAWKGPETPSGKERVSTTYTLPANVTFSINNNGANGYVSINGTGRVSHAKIEKGTVATPWSPAPSEAHPIYMGTYTDFTQADSTNPSDYTWSPIQDGDAIRDGTKETISVTTRGIRFNIPKTLTVGSNITLRYEEYPLGIVPIGNEPSGYFGGGNRQSLSAKVISTANGSSVVEVAGNVIDVGNKNLFKNTTNLSSTTTGESWSPIFYPSQVYDSGIKSLSGVSAITFSFNVYVPSNVEVGEQCYFQLKGQNSKATDWGSDDWNTLIGGVEYAIKQDDLGKTIYLNYSIGKYYKYQSLDTALADTASIIIRQGSGTPGLVCSKPKLETGDQVTPYAAFVDGDTFTAQPDGTCALFSEYKALYY